MNLLGPIAILIRAIRACQFSSHQANAKEAAALSMPKV